MGGVVGRLCAGFDQVRGMPNCPAFAQEASKIGRVCTYACVCVCMGVCVLVCVLACVLVRRWMCERVNV